MYRLITTLVIVLIFSVPVLAGTTIGLELYPQRMDKIFDNDNLINGKEWFATTVEVEKTFFDHLNIRFNIKTFLFGMDGLSYYPSSVKFTNSISYTFKQIKIEYSHFCHHYFKQFRSNLRSKQNKVTFEYKF